MARVVSPTPGPLNLERAFDGVPDRRIVDDFWGTGRIGRIARAFLDDDQRGATDVDETDEDETDRETHSETWLERQTDRNRDERAVVLHRRRVPNSRDTIDHLVVAPSGIWVVDAVALAGKVAGRNVGGWFAHETRLFVSDVDQSALLSAIERKADAVERTLDQIDVRAVTVDRAACFTSAEWPRLFPKPLRIGNVWVTWPSNLVEMIVADGPLDVEAVHTVARHLDERFTPATR